MGLITIPIQAQAPAGEEYIVQTDDWLSRIAEKEYGDPLVMVRELAYLTALENANWWSHFPGQLAVNYENEDGSSGTLFFDPAWVLTSTTGQVDR